MNARSLLLFVALTIFMTVLAGCTGLQPVPMEEAPASTGEGETAGEAMAGASHAEGLVVSHPATGAMEPIEGATAHIVRSEEGVLAQMHTVGLEPGYVYTAWWVSGQQPRGL